MMSLMVFFVLFNTSKKVTIYKKSDYFFKKLYP